MARLIYIWRHSLTILVFPNVHSGLSRAHPHERIGPREFVMSAAYTLPADIQKRLEGLKPSDDKYRPLLHELLNHRYLKEHILGLDGHRLEGVVELLDGVGGEADIDIHRN